MSPYRSYGAKTGLLELGIERVITAVWIALTLRQGKPDIKDVSEISYVR